MKLLILLSVVIACVAAQSVCNDDQIKQYKKWQREHNRPIFSKEEELKRCTHFLRALEHVTKNNGDNKGHKVALNELADLSPEEYKTRHGIILPDDYKHESSPATRRKKAAGSYPPSKDWRDENIITHVKNQADCGSCWSFAATGAIESHYAKKTGKLVSLSEQNLVDCVSKNNGCGGGWPSNAFKEVKKLGGIDTEKSYPYKSGVTTVADKTCNFNPDTIGAKVTGYVAIPQYDTEAMLDAVGNIGPVVVTLDDTGLGFQLYRGGIYNNPDCANKGPKSMTHAMLIVGYGTDTTNSTGLGDVPYWIVKNQWGTTWGDNGYMLMSRDNNIIKNCGIDQFPVYATV